MIKIEMPEQNCNVIIDGETYRGWAFVEPDSHMVKVTVPAMNLPDNCFDRLLPDGWSRYDVTYWMKWIPADSDDYAMD